MLGPSERAQDTFEYLLVVGVLAVPLAAALILGVQELLPGVLGHLCPAVDSAADPAPTLGSCLGF